MCHRGAWAVSFRLVILCLAICPRSLAARQQATTAPPGKTQVVLLGTGNPFPDPDRSGPATAIVVNGSAYLVDFGPGVVRRATAAMFDKGIKALEPTNLTVAFLTHLHSDHTVGYPDLIFTPWVMGRKVPLEVYGPKGLKTMTDHVLAAWQADIEERIATETWQPSNYRDTYKVNVHEINPGVVYKDANVTVTAFPTKHAFRESYGYRFETADRSIVISGDTTATQATIDGCHGCDVLVHEVNTLEWLAKRPDFQPYAAKYHTTTTQLGDLFPSGAPYDPFLLASHLGVSVQEIDLKGVDGYVESFKGDYRVFLSSRAPFLRRRFTLSHELAHVIFMRTAKKGGIKDSYLVRYRRNGLPTSEFQDEREERLCNAFAEEFLLPTEVLSQRGFSSDLRPCQILGVASEFRVSMHAAAVKFSKLFGRNRLVSSLWSLKTPWPTAAWWAGGTSWFRKKWLLKSDTSTLEQLAKNCVFEQREVTQIWAARGKRTFAIKIRMAPTNSGSYAMAVLSPCKPPRQTPPKMIVKTAPVQLNLFGGS